jgi:hypothetical protein
MKIFIRFTFTFKDTVQSFEPGVHLKTTKMENKYKQKYLS